MDAKPEERERKLATVVFADLVGSTALGGSQDPEQTRALLDRFYDAMAAEIDAAGGTVEKFAGDAVMAAFGAPAALEDHAERALHAALAMQRRLRELFGDALALRIGVNTGDVVVGTPREGSSFVTGDCVNVAARLEQAASPGEILAGERTVASARGAFEFGEARTVEAKGKPEGVRCRRVDRSLSLMRPRGVGGLRRAFVGRDFEVSELEQLHDAVVRERRPQLVTILGDAGVGKTTLIREFWDRLAAIAPATLRRTGRCLSYGQGITYWPLAEVLREQLNVTEADSPDVVLERLAPREILALTLGIDLAHGLHPLTARDRFQDAWVEFLETLVADRACVMLVEDLHWAEEPLLNLLERLVRDTRGPLLVVATARPELLEQHGGWGARVGGKTLALDELSADDSVRMLDSMLGGTFPPALRDVVVQRAGGNPFFVEELLATLIDRQLLRRDNGSWRLDELPREFTVPDTVQAVVAARIDLLDPEEKQALQAASVIGRVFWASPVYELVADAEPDLRVLEDRDFIRRRPGSSLLGDREYAIKHALTREVAYASLPRAKRAHLHAAFARWLERTGNGRDEDAPLLAHHYAEAVRPEDVELAWADDAEAAADLRARALRWLRRAAELAVGRFEIDEGLALLHRALELAPLETERVDLWRAVGRANVLKFDGEAFWTAMQNSLEGSDRATAAATYSELAFETTTRGGMWKRRPARELIGQWVERALELSDPETPARARALIARAILDPAAFGDAARDASDLADRLGDDELRSFAFAARAWVANAEGEYEQGYEWMRRRLALAARMTDLDHIAWMHDDWVVTCVLTARIEDARRAAHAHDDVTRTLTPHHRLHTAALLVRVETRAGCWEHVRALTSRAEEAVGANLATPCVHNVGVLLDCALAHAHVGNADEARRLEQRADELGMEGYMMFLEPSRIALSLARHDLGDVERRLATWAPRDLGDVPGWAARLNALVALCRRVEIERDAPPLLKPRTYVEPFALRALGFARDDSGLVERAVERFRAIGLNWHAAETERLLSARVDGL